MQRDVEDLVGGVVGDRVDRQVDARGEDLVPAVDAPDQPAGAFEGSRAADGVREGGVGGEVAFDGGALEGGRGLG